LSAEEVGDGSGVAGNAAEGAVGFECGNEKGVGVEDECVDVAGGVFG